MSKYILPVSHSGMIAGTFNQQYVTGPAIVYLENTNATWADEGNSTYVNSNTKFLLFINQGYQTVMGANSAVVYLDLWFKRNYTATFTPFVFENNFFKFDGKYMHLMYSSSGWNSIYTSSSYSYSSPRQVFHVYCGVELTLKTKHTLVWEECSNSTLSDDIIIYYPDDGTTQLYPEKTIINKRFTLKTPDASYGVTKPPRRILKYIVFDV